MPQDQTPETSEEQWMAQNLYGKHWSWKKDTEDGFCLSNGVEVQIVFCVCRHPGHSYSGTIAWNTAITLQLAPYHVYTTLVFVNCYPLMPWKLIQVTEHKRRGQLVPVLCFTALLTRNIVHSFKWPFRKKKREKKKWDNNMTILKTVTTAQMCILLLIHTEVGYMQIVQTFVMR